MTSGLFIVTAHGEQRFLPGLVSKDAEMAMERGYVRYNDVFLSTVGARVEIVSVPDANGSG